MKSTNKAFMTIILAGVAFLMIGLTILGISFMRNGVSVLFKDRVHLLFSAARNPVSTEEQLENVQSVTLRLGAVNVNILPGDRTELVADGFDKDELNVKIDEATGRLTVEQKDYDRIFKIAAKRNSLNDITRYLTLYVDAEQLEKLDMELGCGFVTMDALSVDSARFRVGAASLELDSVTFGRADMSFGAGDFQFDDCDFCDFSLECGAAAVDYSGKLSGNCTLECGVGDLMLTLSDSAENYFFTFKQGIGGISLNDSDHVGFGDFVSGNTAAPCKITIQAGIGAVDIWTAI